MERIYTALTLVAISLLGLVGALIELRRLAVRQQSLEDFIATLGKYLESHGRDFNAYAALTENAMKTQKQMGPSGVFHHFRAAFSNEAFSNYPIVINHLPRLHAYLSEAISDATGQANHYRMQLIEALIRHRGELVEERSDIVATLKNPLAWFAKGVRAIVAAPLYVLSSFGLIATTTFSAVTASALFRLLAALVGLVGFVSAVVGIVTGWEQFAMLLRKHAPWLPWL